MARLSKEELDKIKNKYNVSVLYSWSRINCFMTSPYEYYLRYVIHKDYDVDNCAYAPIGGICHSIIEEFYGGKIKYEDMINEFEDGWLTAIDLADLKFDRNDETKNETIKRKYKENIDGFFRNHNVINHKVALEKFVTTKIGSNVLQGYIDCCFKDDDGNYNIVDWKTSTKYSGKTSEEKCGQLVVYALGLSQLGIPIENIRICWNFLKYCTVQYEQKNGAVKTRDIERYKLGESLQTNCRMWLKALGYDDKADDYLKMLIDTNSIDVLPDDVRAKYVVSDCYVYVPLTDKLIDKWVNTITFTIRDICSREKDYAETHSDKCFWDTEESVKSESYYLSTLCGYSANLHKPYKEYLDKLESQKNGADMFGGLLNDSKNDVVTSQDICNNNTDEVDLSWLDGIV